MNPFAKRDSHSANSIITYKVLTLATWLLSAISTVYYNFEPPHDGQYHGGTIWHQNYHHYSGFTLNSVITSIYWCVVSPLFLHAVFPDLLSPEPQTKHWPGSSSYSFN